MGFLCSAIEDIRVFTNVLGGVLGKAHAFTVESFDAVVFKEPDLKFEYFVDIRANKCYLSHPQISEGGWSPQVVIALAVTREGLPVRSWVFPDNTTDVGTVEKVRSDLRGWNLNRAIFIADAGKNSPVHVENTFLQPVWPKSTGSNRMSLADTGSIHGDQGLHAKEVVVGEGGR